jgi:AraC-like DNA-binding protein
MISERVRSRRARRETRPPGPDPLADEAIPATGAEAARTLIERYPVRMVSSLLWRTGPDWRIPRRVLADSLLFVPIVGTFVVEVGGRRATVASGAVALIPEGVAHAARYARGCRALEVIAVHVRMADAWGRQAFARFADPVAAVAEPAHWLRRWRALTALINRDLAAGQAVGAVLVADLLAELALGGAPLRREAAAADPRIAAAVALIGAGGRAPSVAALARAAGLSAVRFRALFRRATGLSPKAFICRERLRQAAERLRRGDEPVKAIAAACGFASDHYFHQRFKRAFALTASAYRRQGGGGPGM